MDSYDCSAPLFSLSGITNSAGLVKWRRLFSRQRTLKSESTMNRPSSYQLLSSECFSIQQTSLSFEERPLTSCLRNRSSLNCNGSGYPHLSPDIQRYALFQILEVRLLGDNIRVLLKSFLFSTPTDLFLDSLRVYRFHPVALGLELRLSRKPLYCARHPYSEFSSEFLQHRYSS